MINIPCKKCGKVIGYRQGSTVTTRKGQQITPSDDIDGVILKCVCGRTRTYYLREDEKPVKSIVYGKPQNIV